jgi:hypothetical protein
MQAWFELTGLLDSGTFHRKYRYPLCASVVVVVVGPQAAEIKFFVNSLGLLASAVSE